MNDLVSVIIPKTPREDISECIESIEKSSYRPIEIIVIDEGKERSEQRNIGISRSKGIFLLVLDSDQFIHKYLIEDCVNKIRAFGYTALYIPEIIVTEGWFGRLRNWERQFYTGTEIDCVRFVIAKDCPLFDASMSGPEDSDWDKRIEGRKGISSSYLMHRDNVTPFKYFKKKAYYTKSMDIYAQKWPKAKVLDFKYRCWTVFTENGKWAELIKHPLRALGIYTIIFIRGFIYLCLRRSR